MKAKELSKELLKELATKELSVKEKYDLLFDKRDELVLLAEVLELQNPSTYSCNIICFGTKEELYQAASELGVENISFKRWNEKEYAGKWKFDYRGTEFYYLVRTRGYL